MKKYLFVLIAFGLSVLGGHSVFAATTITSFTASNPDINGISELSWRTSDYTKAEISFSCPDASMTLYVPEDRRTVRCDKGGLVMYTIPQNYNVIDVRANPQGNNVYIPVTFTLTLLKEGANGELFSTGETRSLIAQLPAAGSSSITASCPTGALFNPMTGVRCSVASTAATLTAPSFGSVVSSTIARPTLSQDLSVGSRGDQVVQLQQILVKAALLAPDNATGYFGNMTLEAVKKFQAQKGLPVVGRVGPMTRTALSNY